MELLRRSSPLNPAVSRTLVMSLLFAGCAHEASSATNVETPGEVGTTSNATTETNETTATTEAAVPTERATPAASTEAVATDVAPEETPTAPAPIDMTDSAAPTLCASYLDDREALRPGSAFRRGGIVFANGSRADVLECEYDDSTNGETRVAFLVVRTPGADYATQTTLGESYDAPGNSVAYRVGRLERRADGLRVQVTVTDTIYPDTGNPDSSTRPIVERQRSVFTCTREPEYGEYACARE